MVLTWTTFNSFSNIFTLKVPPTVIETQTSQAVDVIEHWDAVIQCKADGHPKANISWCRDDGSPIKLKGIGSSNGDNKQLEMQSMISIEARKLYILR